MTRISRREIKDDDKEEDEEESAIQTQIEDDFAVALCVPHVLISYPVGDTNAASYTVHKHIQTNKAFFNRDTHIQYTEMFALLKLFFFFLF